MTDPHLDTTGRRLPDMADRRPHLRATNEVAGLSYKRIWLMRWVAALSGRPGGAPQGGHHTSFHADPDADAQNRGREQVHYDSFPRRKEIPSYQPPEPENSPGSGRHDRDEFLVMEP
jgi:hypothetical protein